MDEMEKAKTSHEEEVTLFDKIVSREIPADIIYEDDLVTTILLIHSLQALAFRDKFPVAHNHFLVVPKDRQGLTGLRKAEEKHTHLLGHLMHVVAKVAA